MKVPRVIMLAVMLAFCMSSHGHSAYGNDEKADKKTLERIKREMLEKKKEIKRAKRKERSILSELDKIDRDIQSGSAELAEHRKRLREAENALREVEQNNIEINRKLAGLKQLYGMRLRALYKMSRSGNLAILSTDSLGGALKRVEYLSMIAERDRTIMREYGSSLERLAARQAQIAEKKEAILTRKRDIEVSRAELKERKRKKAELLAGVRKKKSLYEQTFHELEESSTSLWAMIKRSEEEKKAREAVAPSPAAPGSPLHAGRGLPWPAQGKVLTRFGMQRHPQFGTMVFRRGIEIAARVGEEIRAVSDGQVVYADWYKGYGKLIILDHGNGFYTLYGNLSRLDLKKGDRASKGQVIGLAGDTGSTKGTKLYFEIRRNGEAQDPLAWLTKK
jgi:septal ring factor EnvC (AmiA/AmiB activator)